MAESIAAFCLSQPGPGPCQKIPGGDVGDIFSDTYHLWTLIGVTDYFLYSGDRSWVLSHWPQIKKAVAFSIAKIGPDGLLSVNLPLDWGRDAAGGEKLSAN